MMDRVRGLGQAEKPQSRQQEQVPAAPPKASFGQVLRQVQTEKENSPAVQPQQGINFSKHAISRAEERGIELTPALMEQLAGSVEKAQEKGAKNILAFNATQAFIINVPFGRVITTMNQDEMKENIFTNIDGAVLI